MTTMVDEQPTRSGGVALLLAAARLLAVGALVFFVQDAMGAHTLGGVLIGLVVVELLGARAGLKWDETGNSPARLLLRRGVVGLGGGAAAAVAVLVAAAIAGRAKLDIGDPGLVAFAIGAALPLAQAARDELLFRGLTLALLRGKVPDRFALLFAALLGAAPVVLLPATTALGAALVFVTGFVFAVLWRLGKGAYLAWGAHAGWVFLLGAGSRGQLLDVSLGQDQLFPVSAAQGLPGWLALAFAVVVAGAVGWAGRRMLVR
ncbi:MAG: hypothetical protein MUF54_20655 [Polyangiaceae bacterium]|jgi:hypothetical protein|nr:hypothetical protein [Polyangiaceae bacterium]